VASFLNKGFAQIATQLLFLSQEIAVIDKA
jgi:hypothetical protein